MRKLLAVLALILFAPAVASGAERLWIASSTVVGGTLRDFTVLHEEQHPTTLPAALWPENTRMPSCRSTGTSVSG
jgi:hypothetical protein